MFTQAEIIIWNQEIRKFVASSPNKSEFILEFLDTLIVIYNKDKQDQMAIITARSRELASRTCDREFSRIESKVRFRNYFTKILIESALNFLQEGDQDKTIKRILSFKFKRLLLEQKENANTSAAKAELIKKLTGVIHGKLSPTVTDDLKSMEHEYLQYADDILEGERTDKYRPLLSAALFILAVLVARIIYLLSTTTEPLNFARIFLSIILPLILLTVALGFLGHTIYNYASKSKMIENDLSIIENEFSLSLESINIPENAQNFLPNETIMPHFKILMAPETIPKHEKGQSSHAFFMQNKGMTSDQVREYKERIKREQKEAEEKDAQATHAPKSEPQPEFITWQNIFNNRQAFVKEFKLKKSVVAYAYLQESVLIKEMGSDLLNTFAALLETKTKSAAPIADEGIKPLTSKTQYWGYFDDPKIRFPLNYELKPLDREGRILGYSIVPDIADHRSPLVVFCVYQKTHQKKSKTFKVPPLTLPSAEPGKRTESNNNNNNSIQTSPAAVGPRFYSPAPAKLAESPDDFPSSEPRSRPGPAQSGK